MRVPHELLSVPIFLGGRDSNRRLHYQATAFLVGHPTPSHPRIGSTALVTARHDVLHALEEYENVWIRLNTRDGRARDVEITAQWQFPDDSAVDLAAVPFYPPTSGWEVLPIPTDWFVTNEMVANRGVGPGDDIAVMHLFFAHPDAERNLPIVRCATMASMLLQPLVDQASGTEFSAYLAEVRSTVGLSGSPVFVTLDAASRAHAGDASDAEDPHPYLLGLIRGHLRPDAPAHAAPALDTPVLDVDDGGTRQLNAAIAMITPASELIPLLQREAFVEFGRKMDTLRAGATGVERMRDTARAGQPSEFDRFEDLTRTLVNVPTTEIDETNRRNP